MVVVGGVLREGDLEVGWFLLCPPPVPLGLESHPSPHRDEPINPSQDICQGLCRGVRRRYELEGKLAAVGTPF